MFAQALQSAFYAQINFAKKVQDHVVSNFETNVVPTLEKLEKGDYATLQADFTKALNEFNPLTAYNQAVDLFKTLAPSVK